MDLTRTNTDLVELMQLEARYSALFDSRSAEAWADLFTADGSYQGGFFRRSPGDPLATGRDELIRLCIEHDGTTWHSLGLPILTVDGDIAVGRVPSISVVMQDQDGATRTMLYHGYYDVRYARTPQGWRISHRVSYTVTLQEHYRGDAVPALPTV
ncbi:nuclear transport factor 2 family protein [Microbacterium atlanticum]|uniref:nuclear transport factor 2 family protein n=1 Tax=Microbacterium atlanticum TaxID=2782168 RepID=UPI001886FAF7|nr:nuclear transport factor 2 family protein [Microbacterium atlanticum]